MTKRIKTILMFFLWPFALVLMLFSMAVKIIFNAWKMKYTVGIVIASAIIWIGRFLVPGHDISWPGTYEAFAHIWVGSLLTLCFLKNYRKISIWCLLGITALEVVMFMLR